MSKRFQAGDYMVRKSTVSRFNIPGECYWITYIPSNVLVSEWDTYEDAKAECRRLAKANAPVLAKGTGK